MLYNVTLGWGGPKKTILTLYNTCTAPNPTT